jgi:signal transduction histidine kinase
MTQGSSFRKGLAFRMMLSIFLAVAGIFLGIFIYNYFVTRNVVIDDLDRMAAKLTESTVSRVDRTLHGIAKIPENIAYVVEANDFDKEQLINLLDLMVAHNPEIYGCAIAFEPNYQGRSEKFYSFYAYRPDSGQIINTTLGNENYDYHLMDWYQIPRETGKPYWTEPYFDEGGGNILMSTYSVPLYHKTDSLQKFIGVLTADLSLEWLRYMVDSIHVFETGYGFLISSNGTIVTHPVKELIMNASVFSIAEERTLPELRALGKKMIRHESGFMKSDYRNIYNDKISWISYHPVPSSGWALAVVFPVEEFMADITLLNYVLVILGIGGLLVIFILILIISRNITRPLRKLTYAAERFAEGDFNVALPDTKSKDEIGRLTHTFRYMQKTLAEKISDLKELSEKLRISNEKLEEYSKNLEVKVQERTAELVAKNKELDKTLQSLQATQDQLIQSEKMASLGQLTAGIAHEIKNPLNFVNNFSELSIDLAKELQEELEKMASGLDPKDLDYLLEIIRDLEGNAQKIQDHGKRADSIIRGMLLHSRGKSGERQPTNLNNLLEEYVNLGYHGMRATDPSFNVKIESDYDPDLGMVEVVPQDISRVFLNIVNNACQATAQKKQELKEAYFPILSVSTKKTEDAVVIRIRDNGKGIPQDIMDKIFNPFFTTKDAGKGTGLGLSISYDIVVQEHQGTLKVESEPGEFTEFIIQIPLNYTQQ